MLELMVPKNGQFYDTNIDILVFVRYNIKKKHLLNSRLCFHYNPTICTSILNEGNLLSFHTIKLDLQIIFQHMNNS